MTSSRKTRSSVPRTIRQLSSEALFRRSRTLQQAPDSSKERHTTHQHGNGLPSFAELKTQALSQRTSQQGSATKTKLLSLKRSSCDLRPRFICESLCCTSCGICIGSKLFLMFRSLTIPRTAEPASRHLPSWPPMSARQAESHDGLNLVEHSGETQACL